MSELNATKSSTHEAAPDGLGFLVIAPSPFGQELCLISRVAFQAQSVICQFGAERTLKHPDRLTIQIDDERHIHLMPSLLQYINHGCEPNVFFDVGQRTLVCVRPIAAGEELTAFYPATEWEMASNFECHCGSSSCLRSIRGAKHVSPGRLLSYHLSRHIKVRAQRMSANPASPSTT